MNGEGSSTGHSQFPSEILTIGRPTFHDASVDPRKVKIDWTFGVVDLDVRGEHRRGILPQHQPEVSVERKGIDHYSLVNGLIRSAR